MSLLEIQGGLWNPLVRAFVCNFSESLAGSLWCLFVALQVLWCYSSKASMPSCTQMPPAIQRMWAPHQHPTSGETDTIPLCGPMKSFWCTGITFYSSPSLPKERSLELCMCLLPVIPSRVGNRMPHLFIFGLSSIQTFILCQFLQCCKWGTAEAKSSGTPSELECWMHSLLSPSWMKSQRPGVLAWHWAVVA